MSDIRLAIRALLKARNFTTVAVVTLAIGIGLVTAAFGVMNAYLLRSLPYPESRRLYSISYAPQGQPQPRDLQKLDWAAVSDVIENPIAWDLDMFYLVGGDHPEQLPGAWVTPDFIRGFGVRVEKGRMFEAEDYQAGSPQVALISHSLWRSRFGDDPAIVGKRFEAYVSDRPNETEVFTIIGVLPPSFWHVNPYTNIFAPLRAETYPYMARLREGISPADAESRITSLIRNGNASLPSGYRVQLRSTHGEYVRTMRPVLYTVGAAAGIVLLIACANVAFLMLIRSARREKEVALRLAIGAGRWQIARMLISESLVICTAATALGSGLSSIILGALAPVIQQQLGRRVPGGDAALAIDYTVILAAGAIGLAVATLVTLAPLLASWRRNLVGMIRRGRQDGSQGAGGLRTRSILVALEVAGTLSLLVGCGLMIRTATFMLNVDLGIQAEQAITASLALRERSYPDSAGRLAFYDRLLAELHRLPGVSSAALVHWPVHAEPQAQPVYAAGETGEAGAGVIPVSPEYFDMFGIRVIEGRGFTSIDRPGTQPVAVVSETLARRLWPAGVPLGNHIRLGDADIRTIIGIVKDVRQSATDQNLADLYLPLLQSPGRFATMYLKVEGDTAMWTGSVRSMLKGIDPEASLNPFRQVDTLIAEQFVRPRFLASLLTGFSIFALALALIGLYGVIAYGVRQREHEIAVRMAVGADPGSVTRMFMLEGGRILILGLAFGILGAIFIGRLLESQLHHVQPFDLSTLLTTSVIITAAGSFATWWPARNAARTDPLISLKEE